MDLISQFSFPPEALADFREKGLVPISRPTPGVTEFQLMGHDKGVGYRFFKFAVLNKVKSEEAGIDIFDEVEMIEWFKDRKNKPTERVKDLPDKLLRFRRRKNASGHMEIVKDEQGRFEVLGGQYMEDYLRFREGTERPGLPIDRWAELSISDVATLKSEGIFTVEQFGALPRDRIEGGKFPKTIKAAFEKAIRYIVREERLGEIKDHTEEVLSLKQTNSKLQDQLDAMQSKIDELMSAAPKKRGRPKKSDLAKAA